MTLKDYKIISIFETSWILNIPPMLKFFKLVVQCAACNTGRFMTLEQISYDCEKITVRTCRAVTMTVPCPSILIGWEMLVHYVIGWENFLNAMIFHTHTKSALEYCTVLLFGVLGFHFVFFQLILHPPTREFEHPTFTLNDGIQPAVSIMCKERNVLVATFSRLVLRNIGTKSLP
jgi:hypothetical protein